jgi:hypothetical protein
VGGRDRVQAGGFEGDHDPIAGPGRLAVEGRAEEDIGLLALEAIAGPAAVQELALIVDGAQHRVVEGQGALHVQGADGDVADHVGSSSIWSAAR